MEQLNQIYSQKVFSATKKKIKKSSLQGHDSKQRRKKRKHKKSIINFTSAKRQNKREVREETKEPESTV